MSLQILTRLEAQGVRFIPDGQRLIVDAPVGILTETDRAALRSHKSELLALLSAPSFAELYAGADEAGQYALDERAAVFEFDGGHPRAEAERFAALEYVARFSVAETERVV
jgi:hypothetical protein